MKLAPISVYQTQKLTRKTVNARPSFQSQAPANEQNNSMPNTTTQNYSIEDLKVSPYKNREACEMAIFDNTGILKKSEVASLVTNIEKQRADKLIGNMFVVLDKKNIDGTSIVEAVAHSFSSDYTYESSTDPLVISTKQISSKELASRTASMVLRPLAQKYVTKGAIKERRIYNPLVVETDVIHSSDVAKIRKYLDDYNHSTADEHFAIMTCVDSIKPLARDKNGTPRPQVDFIIDIYSPTYDYVTTLPVYTTCNVWADDVRKFIIEPLKELKIELADIERPNFILC